MLRMEQAAGSTSQKSETRTLLSVSHVVKRFGGVVAVNQVSFDMAEGEILGLIGPNGAGKSTLFNLISAYAPVTSGSIRFCGESVGGLAADDIARLGIARTFQHVKLIGQSTRARECHVGRLFAR